MVKKWEFFNENVIDITYEMVQEVIYFCYFIYEGHFSKHTDLSRIFSNLLDFLEEDWGIFYEIGYKETNELIELTLKKSKDPKISKLILEIYELSNRILPKKPPISEIENELMTFIDDDFSFFLDMTGDQKNYEIRLYKYPNKTTIDDYSKLIIKTKTIIPRLKSIGCQNPILTKTDFYDFEDGRTSVSIKFKI